MKYQENPLLGTLQVTWQFMTAETGFQTSCNYMGFIPGQHIAMKDPLINSIVMINKLPMKKNILTLFFLSTLLCFFPFRAFATDVLTSPETTVISFYKWFIQHDNDQTYPLQEPEIYTYVESKVVERLRNQYKTTGAPEGVDYFLKVQDYDAKNWINHIVVHPAILFDDRAIVVVSFGTENKVNAIVLLKKILSKWKINKVMGTLD